LVGVAWEEIDPPVQVMQVKMIVPVVVEWEEYNNGE